ncbi:MAG: hypothetical protein NXI24_17405 [bacterium]|nr:hypothetical protein [bacterium]
MSLTVRKSQTRRSKRAAALSFGLLIGCVFPLSGVDCLADIRPADMRARPASPEEEARGRALLASSARQYGSAKDYLTGGHARAVFSDSWKAPLSRAVAMHWDENEQNMEIHWRPGSDVARLRVLDGKARGKSFGLTGSGGAYEKTGPGEPIRIVENRHYRFALPTVIYFLEFPFRIQSAEIVRHIGERVVDGTPYDLVFVSWGSEAPQAAKDQYIVYINRATGLMDRLHYTIREKFRFSTAACLYSNYETVNGILMPRTMTLVGAPEPEQASLFSRFITSDGVFHEMHFTEIELGVSLPPAYLEPE